MGDFKKQMTGVFKGDNASGALYTLLIGMALGNLLPSPSDALYFSLQSKLRDKWKRGEISADKYWKTNTLYYYAVPFTYWGLLALLVINIKGDSQKKLKVSGALVGAGVALGIVFKLIQNDKKQLEAEDIAKLKLLYEHPEVIEILKKPEFNSINGQFKNLENIDA